MGTDSAHSAFSEPAWTEEYFIEEEVIDFEEEEVEDGEYYIEEILVEDDDDYEEYTEEEVLSEGDGGVDDNDSYEEEYTVEVLTGLNDEHHHNHTRHDNHNNVEGQEEEEETIVTDSDDETGTYFDDNSTAPLSLASDFNVYDLDDDDDAAFWSSRLQRAAVDEGARKAAEEALARERSIKLLEARRALQCKRREHEARKQTLLSAAGTTATPHDHRREMWNRSSEAARLRLIEEIRRVDQALSQQQPHHQHQHHNPLSSTPRACATKTEDERKKKALAELRKQAAREELVRNNSRLRAAKASRNQHQHHHKTLSQWRLERLFRRSGGDERDEADSTTERIHNTSTTARATPTTIPGDHPGALPPFPPPGRRRRRRSSASEHGSTRAARSEPSNRAPLGAPGDPVRIERDPRETTIPRLQDLVISLPDEHDPAHHKSDAATTKTTTRKNKKKTTVRNPCQEKRTRTNEPTN